ncbi:hypothetical protein JR316_0007035 [Psilocybe cubensis]|uniref:Transmembrane protein n=2 Tax=Psilocybe cubensis TaxID=181762 RepID=A0A8H7Y3X5_PSICU|nr:hypothetical protein JR316_0007035 [Psilocybe cubensis]KAH9480435.1 hypothetical protein JR316_0007035 [Psilocybe cubensis]
MTQGITLFIDDQDPQIQYLCPSIHQRVSGSYYNNTWSSVQDESCAKGWFQYTFYGTGVHVATAIATADASYSVKIDDGEFIPQSGTGSYDSPTLRDGKHTVTYAIGTSTSPPAFDYLTVAAGKSTTLKDHTLAVDDADSSIFYSGSWSNAPHTPAGTDSSLSLYRDTVHWTSTVGDSLQLQFEGSSVSVFGIASNISSGGNITATYTIDGVTKAAALPRGTLDTVPMINLFHADVQPGIHTLIINITDIQAPAALGIDLITYNASFNSIASVPANASPSFSTHSDKSLNARAKVGIAIGTIVGVVAVASVAYVLGRRFLRRRNPKFPLSDTR